MITVKPKKGYKGLCTRCMDNEATIRVWFKYDQPIKPIPDLNFEGADGIWVGICTHCLTSHDRIQQDDSKETYNT